MLCTVEAVSGSCDQVILDIQQAAPPIAELAPALDLILGRAYDPPHSEWRGIGRVIYGILLQNILTTAGQQEYIKAMQTMPFPGGWPRIQSPLHLFSWSLSETGRAVILIPLILRCYGKNYWYKMPFIQNLSLHVGVHPCISSMSSPVSSLVLLFTHIARSISFTGAQTRNPISASQVHDLILECRRSCMLLIDCAEGTKSSYHNAFPSLSDIEDDATKDGIWEDSKVADEEATTVDEEASAVIDENISEAMDEDIGDEHAVQDCMFSSGDVSPPPKPKPKPTPKKGKRSKMSKWDKLRNLPNVHVGLHLADNVREYGYIMNGSVLAGELTHAKWKEMADMAAPPNIMAYLFSKDCMAQSLRLGLAGAWKLAFPSLLEPLEFIESRCGRLIASFLPRSERVDCADEEEDGYDKIYAHNDDQTAIRADVKGFKMALGLARQLGAVKVMNLSTLLADNRLSQLIRQSFQHYGVRNILKFSRSDQIKWICRVSFDTSCGKRCIFNIGDICRLRESWRLCRIEHPLLVKFQEKKYVFFVVRELEECGTDPVLLRDVCREGDVRVIALPLIDNYQAFVLDAPSGGQWEEAHAGQGLKFFLHCNWSIDFM